GVRRSGGWRAAPPSREFTARSSDMPFDFKLPDLGEGIAEVELRRWLVAEGERVAEHQPLLEVETDKAVVEVPSPRAGTVSRIHSREGATVKVGETLVSIATADEEAAAEAAA